jgi:WD40 repeat protein
MGGIKVWNTEYCVLLSSYESYLFPQAFNPVRYELLHLTLVGLAVCDISGKTVCRQSISNPVVCCAYSPCGDYILTGGGDSYIIMWGATDGRVKGVITVPKNEWEDVISIKEMWFYEGDRTRLLVLSQYSVTLINIENYINE